MTAPDRFMYGAVDLSQVKAAAEARETPAGEIPAVTEINAANLEAAVLQRSTQVPVVVLVGTERSPESEQLRADLTALARDSQRGFLVGYVDADRAPEVAQVFGVQVLPTVVAVAAGRPVTSFEGGQPREALHQWTDALVAQVGGQLSGLGQEGAEAQAAEEGLSEVEYAIALAAQGRDAQAVQIFEELGQDPQNIRAAAYLDLHRRLGEAASSGAEKSPETILARADEQAWAGNMEAAFDLALGLLSAGEKERGKERLLELFRLCDPADPAVAVARTRLASALF